MAKWIHITKYNRWLNVDAVPMIYVNESSVAFYTANGQDEIASVRGDEAREVVEYLSKQPGGAEAVAAFKG